MSLTHVEAILGLCRQAGNIMLLNGAETSRVEETIWRIGRASGASSVHSFVTPTGIFISVEAGGLEKTGMIRIQGTTGINLQKVHEVNDLSRRFERGQLTTEEMAAQLTQIEQVPYYYRLRYQHLAAALSSGAFAMLFGGLWPEFLVGAFCGWVTNLVVSQFGQHVPMFLRVFFAALVGATIAVLGVNVSLATNTEAAILGAIIPLVPGISLTNAVRDLMAGELLSGLARASEAFLTAFAIAVAVALVLSFRALAWEVGWIG